MLELEVRLPKYVLWSNALSRIVRGHYLTSGQRRLKIREVGVFKYPPQCLWTMCDCRYYGRCPRNNNRPVHADRPLLFTGAEEDGGRSRYFMSGWRAWL